MIYVKDYQALNELVAGKRPEPPSFIARLPSLVGSVITVHVEGSGCFTGVLVEVLPGSIRLVTRLPDAPRRCRRCGKKHAARPGSSTVIPVGHITAVTYNHL